MKHPLFSASQAAVWTVCPLSALLARLAPQKECGTAAKRGNKLHAMAHDWFQAYKRGDSFEPPMIDGVSEVRGYVEYLIERDQEGQNVLTEEYVGDYLYTYGGTADALMTNEIADLKTGDTIIQAHKNLQLEALAFFADMKGAKLTIYQNNRAQTVMQEESGDIFAEAIEKASTGEATYKKGAHCARCRGKAVCPEWNNKLTLHKSGTDAF
jgi:hypothetical protein